MPDVAHPTRGLLLDAALAVAESRSLPAVSVDEVVRAAGVSKGTFYVHFADRATFLVALHRRFYEHLQATIGRAVTDHPAGPRRLYRATEAYLDHCLRSRGVKAMLLDVRSEPAIAEEIRRNAATFARLAADDLDAAGHPAAAAAGRLYVAMVAEAALMELERGDVDAAARAALAYASGTRLSEPV